ncbi:hypothetical protein [Marinomonas sp. THO17]|uniref:hypothetical protein n=1 Tax=Marinomonas sp. THO17 TaxID=3149048 RepID=UPI00336BE24A
MGRNFTDKSQISQDGKGICGFTHMIQLLIDNNKMTLEDFERLYGSSTNFAEHWLRMQIDQDRLAGSDQVLTALQNSLHFTGDVGCQNSKMTLYQLLAVIHWDWTKHYGFALTPEAICDYLDHKYRLKMVLQIFNRYPTIDELWQSKTHHLGEGIYGIMKAEGAGPQKDQIQHYVYIDKQGELMTWTETGNAAKRKIKAHGFEQVVVRLSPQK